MRLTRYSIEKELEKIQLATYREIVTILACKFRKNYSEVQEKLEQLKILQ